MGSVKAMSSLHIRGDKMNNSFFEKVIVKCLEPLDIQGSTGIVQIFGKNLTLFCFSSNFRQFSSLLPGSEVPVLLSLMTTNCSINNENTPIKKIESFRKLQTPNHCILTGVLVEIDPKNFSVSNGQKMELIKKDYGIVDCGIYIEIELDALDKYHIGDIISAEGRLDIKKN